MDNNGFRLPVARCLDRKSSASCLKKTLSRQHKKQPRLPKEKEELPLANGSTIVVVRKYLNRDSQTP